MGATKEKSGFLGHFFRNFRNFQDFQDCGLPASGAIHEGHPGKVVWENTKPDSIKDSKSFTLFNYYIFE